MHTFRRTRSCFYQKFGHVMFLNFPLKCNYQYIACTQCNYLLHNSVQKCWLKTFALNLTAEICLPYPVIWKPLTHPCFLLFVSPSFSKGTRQSCQFHKFTEEHGCCFCRLPQGKSSTQLANSAVCPCSDVDVSVFWCSCLFAQSY